MFETYQQTISFLFAQLPMYQKVGKGAFKKDLINIIRLMDTLDNPQEKLRCIHVGGTNGKGSTTHILSAIFQAAGYKVGVYTSPHYRDFRERIKINQTLVSEEWVVNFVRKYHQDWSQIQPSFFEITVAMAFQYFEEQKVDIAIIEVGLGGRLDSTNIITPELSVITNISFDHMQFLGDSLEAIAREKAGIIKSGVPVVIGETHPKTQSVFRRKADDEKADIFFADQIYDAQLERADFKVSLYTILKDGIRLFEHIPVDVYGNYQKYNVQTALCVTDQLAEHWQITMEHIRNGLAHIRKQTNFIGRWQVIDHDPLILCDSGHNEAGIQSIVHQLEEIPHQKLHMVLGVVNDKDLSMLFQHLPEDAFYYYSCPNVPRGLPASALATAGRANNRRGETWPTISDALQAAKEQAGQADLIFVGGSIFVVAEVI
ncbi:MAG: bifunctional folylpolyglutamate synthase/dihydrofolate synthase [Saprospiraceae bacterium]|nr:bifunctional folylpolyglutamate synthase/dihydrofolate synthase [Saprospiraceae bacterium]